MGQGTDTDELRPIVLGHAPGHFGLKERILIPEPVTRPTCFKLGANPGENDGRLDWLGKVVSGTELQSVLLLISLGKSRKKNYRDIA